MKILKDEYGYNIFYEVDDLSSFDEDAKIEDFEKLKEKRVCFVNDEYELYIVELNKKENFYKYKDYQILLLVSDGKYFEANWSGHFLNVMEASLDEYETEMLDKIRNSGVNSFTTQF